jgi:hypothetical protein
MVLATAVLLAAEAVTAVARPGGPSAADQLCRDTEAIHALSVSGVQARAVASDGRQSVATSGTADLRTGRPVPSDGCFRPRPLCRPANGRARRDAGDTATRCGSHGLPGPQVPGPDLGLAVRAPPLPSYCGSSKLTRYANSPSPARGFPTGSGAPIALVVPRNSTCHGPSHTGSRTIVTRLPGAGAPVGRARFNGRPRSCSVAFRSRGCAESEDESTAMRPASLDGLQTATGRRTS